MKILKNKTIYFLLLLILVMGACNLEETNINPNSVTETPAHVLLPYSQESLARLMIGTTQVMSGIFMQYYEGIDNHPLPVQNYTLNEALYVDWDWNDYYNAPMINLKKMIEVAEKDNYYHYTGIGKILTALCLGNVTSLWGDVPYSEALLGSETRSPKYDNQQSIYETIQDLLDDGISDLEQNYSGKKPSEDDLIFNGNTIQWIQTAYALKARYYLHLTKRTNDLSFNPAEQALIAASNAYATDNNDLIYWYGYSAAESNPFNSFCKLNYIIPNNSYVALLNSLNDPRKNFLLKIKFGSASVGDAYFSSTGSPVHMMTYHELKFIEAEARLRQNANDPEITTALNEAIYVNMKKLSDGEINDIVIDNYITDHIVLSGNFESDLETIITQKYIALYSSIEPWTDYRRTGYPVLIPNQGGDHNQNPGGAIPRRLAYPQTERLYNQNFPNQLPTLQDRFWWDE